MDVNGISYRPGNGGYQVIQVLTEKNGWQCIYERHDMPQHYTVQAKLMHLVKRFIRESKINQAIAAQ